MTYTPEIKGLALPSGTGLSSDDGAASVSTLRASIPSAGLRSLHEIGVHHYYETGEWECTYEAGDIEFVSDILCEAGHYGRSVLGITTLIEGPRLFAVYFPISWVENSDPGDIDDWEVRFFASAEEAQASVAQAIEARRAETLGSVHESAVPGGNAP